MSSRTSRKYKYIAPVPGIPVGTFGHVFMVQCISGEHAGLILAKKRQDSNEYLDPEMSISIWQRELNVLREITHKNIVRLYDFDNEAEDGILDLYVEFCNGESLQSIMRLPIEDARRQKISTPTCMWLMTWNLFSALQYCHSVGSPSLNRSWEYILHRDIKPGNILLHYEDSGSLPIFKFCDMGNSFLVGGSNVPAQTYSGTQSYWSPEIVESNAIQTRLGLPENERRLPWSRASDIWALCKTIDNAVARLMPNTEYCTIIQAFVAKGLVKTPSDRPNATTFLDNCDELHNELGLSQNIDELRGKHDVRPSSEQTPVNSISIPVAHQSSAGIDSSTSAYPLRIRNGSQQVIGYGSDAAVYKIVRPKDGLVIAQKRFHIQTRPGRSQKRTIHELSSYKKLQHPFIVSLFDYELKDGYFIQDMEFCEGGTLRDFTTNRGSRSHISSDIIWIIFSQIASALAYCHEGFQEIKSRNLEETQFISHRDWVPILHRDIKPSNIFLSYPFSEGRQIVAKLGDFGSAFLSDAEKSASTLAGTKKYWAPELYFEEDYFDDRRITSWSTKSDIWALGSSIATLLSDSEKSRLRQITSSKTVDSRIPKGVPLLSLLAETLSSEPDARPAALAVFYRSMMQQAEPTLERGARSPSCLRTLQLSLPRSFDATTWKGPAFHGQALTSGSSRTTLKRRSESETAPVASFTPSPTPLDIFTSDQTRPKPKVSLKTKLKRWSKLEFT